MTLSLSNIICFSQTRACLRETTERRMRIHLPARRKQGPRMKVIQIRRRGSGAERGCRRPSGEQSRSCPAATATVPSPGETPAPEPVAPEISLAEAAGLPESPATTRPAAPGSTLRVTARLVDVGVVAYDKKGHPVTDLKPEGLRDIRQRAEAGGPIFQPAGGAPDGRLRQGPDPAQPDTLSNRLAAVTQTRNRGTEGNITILLIDSGNLTWADLTNARGEMLRFLQALPANERVGLYAMKAKAFRFWRKGQPITPCSRQSCANGCPAHRTWLARRRWNSRNRQQFDEVLHPDRSAIREWKQRQRTRDGQSG